MAKMVEIMIVIKASQLVKDGESVTLDTDEIRITLESVAQELFGSKALIEVVVE